MAVKKIIIILAFFCILNSVYAANIGVVVEFPDSKIITECINVPDNSDGYKALQKTSFDIGWSEESTFGHALCEINNLGEEVKGTGCDWGSEYWAFFISGGSDWEYSPVGFDAGDSCWNGGLSSYDGHYCAKDKDVLGFAHGPWGARPDFYTYEEICKSRIVFEDITIKVDGKTDSGTINVLPGSKIEVKIKIKNDFNDKEIKNIEVTGTINGIDQGDDIEDDSDTFTLKAGNEKTLTLNFEIPQNVDADDYKLKIQAKGKDNANFEHITQESLVLQVEKEKHDIEFREATVKTSLNCNDKTPLSIRIANNGKEKENVILKIINQDLAINLKESFILSEDPFQKDNEFEKTFQINIPANIKSGIYSLSIRAEYSGKYIENKISLTIGCQQQGKIMLENKQQQTVKKTAVKAKEAPIIGNAVAETKAIDKNNFGILILGAEIIAILVCILIIAKSLK